MTMERTAVSPAARGRLGTIKVPKSNRQLKVRTLVREKEGSPQHDPPSQGQTPLQAKLVKSIDEVGQAAWDACHDGSNPFVCFDFLKALEESRSVDPATGWLPQHLVVSTANGADVVACVPLYLKTHSYGEYVFDSSWAEFHDRYGAQPSYYPKLQSCIPFTPATGPRVLIKQQQGNLQQQDYDETTVRNAVFRVMGALPQELGVSSMHVTFNTEKEWHAMAKEGSFYQRLGVQYHWHNDKISHGLGDRSVNMNTDLNEQMTKYESFEEFLGAMQQKRRKAIRQERKRVASYPGLCIKRLTGDDVRDNAALWDAFYNFYLETIDRKWGVPYLTRDFFQMVSERMADKILLVVADDCDLTTAHYSKSKGRTVAAALNFLGSDAIYGRNWGCAVGDSIKGLHFELCYYQAIEHAISTGASRVEAGAQGEHKLSRGYVPQLTYSNHYIRNPGVGAAIESFLYQERREIESYVEAASLHLCPYKG